MSELGSRHLVSSSRLVRCMTTVEIRRSPVWTRLRSTPSPMMPSFRVTVGQTSSGVRKNVEASPKLATRSSFGGSSR